MALLASDVKSSVRWPISWFVLPRVKNRQQRAVNGNGEEDEPVNLSEIVCAEDSADYSGRLEGPAGDNQPQQWDENTCQLGYGVGVPRPALPRSRGTQLSVLPWSWNRSETERRRKSRLSPTGTSMSSTEVITISLPLQRSVGARS